VGDCLNIWKIFFGEIFGFEEYICTLKKYGILLGGHLKALQLTEKINRL
jgi:hypothetical protein